jgi:flagellar biosynthesis/type III secretory pathway protein FliH
MAIVLKSETAAELEPAARNVSGLAGFNLSDLAHEGRTRLEECRVQVRQMIEAAEKQAEMIRRQADQRGYQEGLARAAVDADKQVKAEAELRARDGLKLIQQAVQQLHTAYEDWLTQYAQSLTQLTIAAAERIVRRKLEREPELLVDWTAEALRSTRLANSLCVAVHPETLARLGTAFDQLLASSDLPEQTHIEPDEAVGLHAVVVRQVGGEIEAGLTAQLQRLEELLS